MLQPLISATTMSYPPSSHHTIAYPQFYQPNPYHHPQPTLSTTHPDLPISSIHLNIIAKLYEEFN